MAFTDTSFVKTRPFLYHLTDRNNLDQIRSSLVLWSAAASMRRAGDMSFLREKRKTSINLSVDQHVINIRDQQPLYAGNMTLQPGFEFGDVVEMLNERVFFWPGKATGPISYGERHFERYANDRPVVLRISTTELFRANSTTSPMYCRFNSGSPRCTKGLGSPRGPATFVTATDADFTPSGTVEVTFLERVVLPENFQISDSITGPWETP